MIRAVRFASCYVYSPIGSCETSECSRLLCSLLKAGDTRFIFKYAIRVRQLATENPGLVGFFDAGDILVPVPRSVPRNRAGVSATEHLAAALVSQGLGRCAWSGLRRAIAVRKSATAPPGARPTVRRHYDSFAVECADPLPILPSGAGHIVLIDDVVTKGRTLLAAAARLHETYPSARIRAFALLRTMGRVPEVDRLLDPCVGEISWRAGDAHRFP
jgi:predicted amidophosphoribosyltransferase